MLDVNERLSSLAGFDMRDVTTTDSDETKLIGTLQLQVAIDARLWRAAADRTTDGRSSAAVAADNLTMPNSLIIISACSVMIAL
jgi:hypothetical protein